MENKIKCVICNKEVTNNNSYIGSHVKRKHNILLKDYAKKYYTNLDDNFTYEKCGFCDNLAEPNIIYDHINLTFKQNYNYGYSCNDEICRNNISLLILKKPYDKKSYEHIGCKSEYLSLLYKISVEDAKLKKYIIGKKIENKSKTDLFGYIERYGEEIGKQKYIERCEKIGKTSKKDWYIEHYGEIEGNEKWLNKFKHKSSLDGFIMKYGEKLGKQKYTERCEKIGKTNKKDWYIEKYGEIEGNKRWDKFTSKLKNKYYNKQSESSKLINKCLNELNIQYEQEFTIKELNNYCDFYIKEYNTIIEYYGDYWHCNPIKYKKDYYHQYTKMTAYEIWEKDKTRINNIHNHFNNDINIIIIWENTIINKDYLLKLLTDNYKKNNIIYI